jgi:hypothetical protein
MTNCKDCECAGSCGNLDKYLLAVVNPEGKEEPLFKDFLESLPKETEVKLEGSLGGCYVGGYKKDYFLYAAPDFSNINCSYFAGYHQDGAVFDIKGLSIHEYFSQKKRRNHGGMNEIMTGKVDEMLEQYQQLSEMSPEALLTQQLFLLIDQSIGEEKEPRSAQTAKVQKERFFKDKGLWRKKTKLAAPTNITLSLNCESMTLDEKDLGTYVGALDNLKRVK